MNNLLSISEYSQLIGIPEQELKGRSRIETIAIARQVYWYILSIKGIGYRAISRLADRTPATVLSGIRSVKWLFDNNHPLIQDYTDIIQRIREAD